MSPTNTARLLGRWRFISFFMSLVMGNLGLNTDFLQVLSGGSQANCRGRGLHPYPSSAALSAIHGADSRTGGQFMQPINREKIENLTGGQRCTGCEIADPNKANNLFPKDVGAIMGKEQGEII